MSLTDQELNHLVCLSTRARDANPNYRHGHSVLSALKELQEAREKIESLESDAAALRKALEEMYDAMLRYQSDAETEAPAAHRQMMHRTRVVLGIEPNDRAARALKGQS